MHRTVIGLFAVTCLHASASQGQSSNDHETWQGYLPPAAVNDALSEPLRYVGKAQSKEIEGIPSCVWRNSKVTVVRVYCSRGPATKMGRAEGVVILPHDERGWVKFYAEPSTGRILNQASAWYVEVHGLLGPAQKKPVSRKSPKEIIAFLDQEERDERLCVAGGSFDPGVTMHCSAFTAGGAYESFQTEWLPGLATYFDETNRPQWLQLFNAMGAKNRIARITKAPPKTGTSEKVAESAISVRKTRKVTSDYAPARSPAIEGGAKVHRGQTP